MLRQTEKGPQSELGRSQAKGHEDDVVVTVLFVGCWRCGGLLHGWQSTWQISEGGTGEREAFLGRLDNILHASRKTGEAVKRLSNVRHMPVEGA